MQYIIIIALIVLSALFSGLTLGLMSLDLFELRRKMQIGDSNAKKIYPLRKDGNLLLTTLLLGNVAVNAILSIFLADIVSGVVAVFIATALIFLFGEIFPQAIISRYALPFGAKMVPFVRLIRLILYPICKPISWLLNRFLGEELQTVYTKKELMYLVSEHEDSIESPLDADEERIVHGALEFSSKTVHEVMTPRSVVYSFESDMTLDEDILTEVKEKGFSRIPIIDAEDADTVVGIIHIRDFLGNSSGLMTAYMDGDILRVRDNMKLDALMNMFLRKRVHMGIVYNEFGSFIGVVTFEDILEEVIGHEIMDEDDVYEDMQELARTEGRRKIRGEESQKE